MLCELYKQRDEAFGRSTNILTYTSTAKSLRLHHPQSLKSEAISGAGKRGSLLVPFPQRRDRREDSNVPLLKVLGGA